jgi:hypothetical protein
MDLEKSFDDLPEFPLRNNNHQKKAVAGETLAFQ